MTVAGSLKRGLVAGVCAGILAALFAFLVAERTVDRAIAFEDQRRAAAHATADQADGSADPVSRDVQRRVGGPTGFVLAGAAIGAIFGLVYAALRRLTDERDPWQRSLFLAATAVSALVVVPFLRYPPNPPGVGDPDSLDARTRYYLASLLLGLSVVVGAWRLLRYLRARGWPQSQRQPLTAVLVVAVLGLGFLALPTPPDQVLIPAKLLWDFRIQSLATQLLLWSSLAAVFGLLSERAARARA
ncbi:MAG: CbtA family protein [Actinomycetota bacterium]